jgi:uncharacterized protein involved in cysteine biosynthesis
MLSSFAKAIGQLSDRTFRRVLLLGVAATGGLYLLLYVVVGWGLTQVKVFDLGWANALLDILGTLAVLATTLLIFPGVATLVLSFLLEDIALAVEAKYYPGLPPPRKQGVIEVSWGALRFAAVTVLVNILALPVTIALALAGIGIGFYIMINGYLLAREYFELVAWRRMPLAEVDALRRAHAGRLWLMGMVVTFLSTIPVINLTAPLIGTAAMLHEFEAFRRAAKS